MTVRLDSPVRYTLALGDHEVDMNALVGQPLELIFSGEIHCVHCGRKTSKSFNQGYCYPCFRSLAQCDSCIIKPEQCHYAAGSCREPEWAEAHCLREHVVYVANSSGVKVGITRAAQLPVRWIDQGAAQALPVWRVSQRYLSGVLEQACKVHVSDRTDWRRMLKGEPEPCDLVAARRELMEQVADTVVALRRQYGEDAIAEDVTGESLDITYPVTCYPEKVSAHNFDKQAEVRGVLQGIKGQYLILDTGVLNVRKFGGYHIQLNCQGQV